MQEIWKDILDFEGLYQVSNLGRIKNLERQVRTKGNALKKVKERIRAPQIKKNGYHITTLCNGIGGTKTVSIHQLVALAFIPNFVKGTQINHIDGNPGNNCINNLEISNASHNQLHAVRTGLKSKSGKSSKYRYVCYIKNQKSGKKWAVSIRVGRNSSFGWKTFYTEEEAAIYADQLLDSIGDTERLRNFP